MQRRCCNASNAAFGYARRQQPVLDHVDIELGRCPGRCCPGGGQYADDATVRPVLERRVLLWHGRMMVDDCSHLICGGRGREATVLVCVLWGEER